MTTSHILTNASEAELANAVEENLCALFRAMAASLGGEIEEGAKLNRHLTFPTNPMFKGVWKTRLTEQEADAAINETVAWFKARNAPFFFWWTGPGTTPVDLPQRLQARGLLDMAEQQQELARGIMQTELGAPGMIADLNRMNEKALTETPSGFIIREVADPAGLDDFKRVFVETYAIPDWAGQAWVDATGRVGIGQTAWKMYVGYLDDQPVATNMLFNGGGVASVYAVAAVAAVRGKGIGGAITLKPLLEARALGYQYGVLFATEMGIHAYERIGFKMTGARINRYLWRNQ